MDRSDIVLLGCGGGGGKLTDTIVNQDSKFISYFINSSKTDIESLDNFDDVAVNYMSISSQRNGMGRDRKLGKRYASKRGMNLLEVINNFDQKVIYIITSFGGGSGSSIASVLLSGIQKLKSSGDFDKTINLIGILPRIDSSTDILMNTLETWNEIMSYNCVNNMIFIDNNKMINGEHINELDINDKFAEMFDSIFDIPTVNGRNFDNGNLGKIMNSEGCMYIYELPDGFDNVKQSLKQGISSSILANMYKPSESIDLDVTGKKRIKCGFVGTSFNNDNYLHDDVLDKYKLSNEDFTGFNEDKNLVLISGCLPPLTSIQTIMAELGERKNEKINTARTNLNSFIIGNTEIATEKDDNSNNTKIKSKKKAMKKSIFDMFN